MYTDVLDTMVQDAQDQLSKMVEVKTELETKVATLTGLKTEIAAALTAAEDKGYEDGLAKAGQAGGSDKLYSDAEMNKFIADAVAPLNEKIATMDAAKVESDAKLADLQAKVDGQAGETAKAIADLKAEFVAGYESAEVDNDALIAKYKTAPQA